MTHSFSRDEVLSSIYENIQDGIIVMDENRIILSMNPSAKRMTGWLLGEMVPYCSFCQKRKIDNEMERCLLISTEEMPYFLSEMPTYHGKKIDVEMSTAQMFHNEETGQKQFLLVLRDQTNRKKEEEAKIAKLFIQKLTEAQEKEHKRLAQELHDGVSQSLYSISLALDNIHMYVDEPRLKNYMLEVRRELDKVLEDIKSYSRQLRPKSLDQLGLIPTIEMLAKSIETKVPVHIEIKTNLTERLTAYLEINIYRIIQEALHNMMKYAEATYVEVSLQIQEDRLHLAIKDNGKGFHYSPYNQGLGLQHMEERVSQLKGEMEIRSELSSGTHIIMQCPIDKEGIDSDQHFDSG